ncbi:hypothetical protein GCM10010329_77440 [Streptomyces spiroverticillatus]|uniref:Intein C-terminal splicing domain-containing protein n=1 Tax=Streptomyces finlayi TaxID=67296 RepID=A0A918X5P3_9ACTN|nr:polymorphic toxin-type HINT domain-containing protein [Streptomyces finlayi]GHA43014.1 hypothetical protein GCM10010329_77440 [Streptomyces spiroverticillatus]GHD13992.1 hypothetical protein GCM10010334_72850 [Streptomyces finlayi]
MIRSRTARGWVPIRSCRHADHPPRTRTALHAPCRVDLYVGPFRHRGSDITVESGSERAAPDGTTRKGTGVPVDLAELASPPGDEGNQVGTGTLIATEGHPFWVPELGKWPDAGDLQPGQWLWTSAGTWVQITVVEKFAQNASVRNLTVANIHTFYVAAGISTAPVHNCNAKREAEVPIPDWATTDEVKQFAAYVDAVNDAIKRGQMSSAGRVSAAGSIRRQAAREAAAERIRAKDAGSPYSGVAGHAPDAMWLGHGKPPNWIDMTKRVNSSLSGQGQRCAIGCKAKKFVLVVNRSAP